MGLRRKKDGKAGFENPYCGPSFHLDANYTLFFAIKIVVFA